MFGKLPAHGDFVSRGLDAAERDALDDWLSGALDAARGEGFEEIYDAAPPWRFVAKGVGGAVAPSVDRVGRRFPIWLAIAGVPEGEAPSAAERCESLIYDAFAEGWDADALIEHAAGSTLEDGNIRPPGWWTEGSEWFDAARLPGERPAGLFRAMLTMREEAQS